MRLPIDAAPAARYSPAPVEKIPKPSVPQRRGERKEMSRGYREGVETWNRGEILSSKARAAEKVVVHSQRTIFVSSIVESLSGLTTLSGEVDVREPLVDASRDTLQVDYCIAQTEDISYDLRKQDDLACFVQRIFELNNAEKTKIADLKAEACEKVGLGEQRKALADADLGGFTKDCLSNLYDVIFSEDEVDTETVKSALEQSVTKYRDKIIAQGLIPDESSTNIPLEAGGLGLFIAAIAARAGLEPRDRKKRVAAAMSLLLILNQALTTCAPQQEFVEANKIPPVAEIFGGSPLVGAITSYGKPDAAFQQLVDKATIACNTDPQVTKYGKPCLTFGNYFVDKQGNKQPAVYGRLHNTDGTLATPSPAPVAGKDVGNPPDPVLFMYVEGDGYGKLVPAGLGMPESGFNMIPLQFWYEGEGENQKQVIGIANNGVEGWELIPILTSEPDGQGGIRYVNYDLFSGQQFVTGDSENIVPEFREIVSLDPLIGLQKPDAMHLAFDALQEEGINVGHDADTERGYWLIVNGEEVPGAFFDEDGKFLHIGSGEGEVKIAVENAADRLELSPDGLLFLKNDQGVNIAFFDPQNPENNFVFFDYVGKFEKAGIDLSQMGNAAFQADGLNIVFDYLDEPVVIPYADLDSVLYNGQDDVLQIRDKANEKVLYAFDAENQTFLKREDVVYYPDLGEQVDFAKLIVIENEDQLQEMFRQEKLFMIPFDPKNTYKPDPDMVNVDYIFAVTNDSRPAGKYDLWNPLGTLPEGMDFPLRPVNLFILAKDPNNGRPYDTVIFSEQVNEWKTQTFEAIHMAMDLFRDGLESEVKDKVSGNYLLPVLKSTSRDFNHPVSITLKLSLQNHGILSIKNDVGDTGFGDEFLSIFTGGEVSDSLTLVFFYPITKDFNQQ